MKEIQEKVIHKAFVHKKNEKNVFIKNMRRIIPVRIDRSIFEAMLPQLNSEEKKYMDYYYHCFDDEYILRGLTPSRTKESMEKLLTTVPIKDRDEIRSCFDETDDGFILKDIDEEHQYHLLMRTGRKVLSGAEKETLYQIMEKFPQVPKKETFYADIIIDMTHPYYFEHENEHVPAMMIMEAFRQFSMALGHAFGNIPLNGFQIILNTMDAQFYRYAELSLPLYVKGVVDNPSFDKKGAWDDVGIIGTIIQNGQVLAEIDVTARILPTGLFERIRKNNKHSLLKAHRFRPHLQVDYKATLFDTVKGQYINIELFKICLNGFCAIIPDDVQLEPEREYSFCFYFQGHGFIQGLCKELDIEDGLAEFQYIDVSDENLTNLKESLLEKCQII